MKVLLTRPRAAAERLAQDLAARGHEVLIEPLLTIEPLPGPLPELAGVQALVITSANAAPALAGTDPRLPVFVVGSATAAAARHAGRRDVRIGEGDARALARLIARQLRPADGALLHLSGSEVRAELGHDLAAAGFALRRHAVYRARAAQELSAEVIAALRAGEVDAVLLFSPRSAATLVDLLARHGLAGALSGTEAICLSEAVAEPCRRLPWRIRVAARPEVGMVVGQLEGRSL
jgi:uroporphyrinogen-III synthase